MENAPATIDPVELNFKHNFIVNVLDVAFFFTGYSFLSTAVIIPLFISNLSDSKLLIGLSGVIGATGYFLPQLFTASFTEKAPVKRDLVVNVGFFAERLPVILMPLAALAAFKSAALALFAFFLLYTAHSFGAGSLAVAWQEMIAKIFPANRRGRFMGLGMTIGTGTGIAGAMAAAWLLDHLVFPYGYLVCFSLAGLFMLISWSFLRLSREEPSPPRENTDSYWEFFRKLPAIFKNDGNFRWFLIGQLVLNLGGMAWVFLAVYTRNRWGLSDGAVGTYNTALLIGQAIGNLALGLWADRRGYYQVMVLSGIGAVLALILSIFVPTPGWMYLVFGLRGISMGGFILASLMVLEFGAEADRPAYIGINSTATGFMGMVAPMVGGWIAQFAGYIPMFVFSTIFTIIGVILLAAFVHEPRRRLSSSEEPARLTEIAGRLSN